MGRGSFGPLAAEDLLAEVSSPRQAPARIGERLLAGMQRGASEAIFGIARAAGWLAHALEEYQRRSDTRPRAIYVGVPIGPER